MAECLLPWREQQLHTQSVAVSMALVQGCFPVPWWVTSRRMTLDERTLLLWKHHLRSQEHFHGAAVSRVLMLVGSRQVVSESLFCCPGFVTPSSPCLNPGSLSHADLWKWANVAVYHRQLLLQGEEGKDSALRNGNGYASAWKDEKDLIPGVILVFYQCFYYISFFLTSVQSSQHGTALNGTSKHQTSRYSWSPPPLPFSCVVMRQQHKARGERKLFRNVKERLFILAKKHPSI